MAREVKSSSSLTPQKFIHIFIYSYFFFIFQLSPLPMFTRPSPPWRDSSRSILTSLFTRSRAKLSTWSTAPPAATLGRRWMFLILKAIKNVHSKKLCRDVGTPASTSTVEAPWSSGLPTLFLEALIRTWGLALDPLWLDRSTKWKCHKLSSTTR